MHQYKYSTVATAVVLTVLCCVFPFAQQWSPSERRIVSDPDPKPALTGAPAQSLTQAQQVTVPTAERNLWKAAANVWQMRASQLYAETMVWQDLFWKRDFEKNKEQALYFSAKTDAAQQELENAHSLAVKTCAEAGQELDERLFSCKPKASETKPANTSQPPRDE